MANPSVLSPGTARSRSAERPAVIAVAPPATALHPSAVPAVSPLGPRKLVRPPLAEVPARRAFSRRGEPALLGHQALADHAIAAAGHDSSHAEAFYFQKQIQTQTLMCFVLDDGERIEGYIEWFDRNAIKVRHSGRTLIYKSSIKYLFKCGENAPV